MSIERSMEQSKDTKNGRQLSRDDWLRAALETMRSTGIDGVKVAPLAARLGVTTGSFYWHFKNRGELLELVLDYWERAMTDAAIDEAERFEGSPEDCILFLMQRVMDRDLAGYDLPIWQWAQSDDGARKVFQRALKKRLEFTSGLFRGAGFSQRDAENRARMMMVYMMGESNLVRRLISTSKRAIRDTHAILMARS
jgi:AcrR family transcriptional regulator